MLKNVAIIVLIVLVIAGGVFIILRELDGKTDVTVTVEGIKEIAQLATVEYTISEVVKVKLPKRFFLEWKNLEFLVQLTGTVTGAVDLDKIEIEIIDEADQPTVNLDFPKGSILIKNPQVGVGDLRKITIFDDNVFSEITDDDENNAFDCAFSQLLKTAEEQGIREKTAAEAEIILTEFLHELGYVANITFTEEDLKPQNIDTAVCDPNIYSKP